MVPSSNDGLNLKEPTGTAADTYRSQLVEFLERPDLPFSGYARPEAAHSRGHRCEFWKPAEPCLPLGYARFDGNGYPCQAPKSWPVGSCPLRAHAPTDPCGNRGRSGTRRSTTPVLVTVSNLVSRTVDQARALLRAARLVLGNGILPFDQRALPCGELAGTDTVYRYFFIGD